MLLYKTLIQVLFAPTRYLFVKDPLAFRQEETSLSTRFLTVKRFLQALSIFLRKAFFAKAGLFFYPSTLLKVNHFFAVNMPREERKKKVLATTYFPTSGLAVSSALEVLTSEFGMESGGSPPPWSPGRNI